MILAQSASPEFMDIVLPLLKGLGVPGVVIFILGYSCRKFVLFIAPHIVDIIKAHVDRQGTMASCTEKLTDSTIKIQTENHKILKDISARLPRMCQMHRQINQQPGPTTAAEDGQD